MVDSIGSTNNLINMITLSYQQDLSEARKIGMPAGPPPPPPPPEGATGGSSQDPLGVFDTVDSDDDGSISTDEYYTLAEGIQEVTGNEFGFTFSDFDVDGDGRLTASELRSVLDEAGFAPPPPPPPEQVVAAYEAQSGEETAYTVESDSMLEDLLAYLASRSDDFDVVV